MNVCILSEVISFKFWPTCRRRSPEQSELALKFKCCQPRDLMSLWLSTNEVFHLLESNFLMIYPRNLTLSVVLIHIHSSSMKSRSANVGS